MKRSSDYILVFKIASTEATIFRKDGNCLTGADYDFIDKALRVYGDLEKANAEIARLKEDREYANHVVAVAGW